MYKKNFFTAGTKSSATQCGAVRIKVDVPAEDVRFSAKRMGVPADDFVECGERPGGPKNNKS
jgi:hypothetical protein